MSTLNKSVLISQLAELVKKLNEVNSNSVFLSEEQIWTKKQIEHAQELIDMLRLREFK